MVKIFLFLVFSFGLAASQTIDCTFEGNSLCSWTQDTGDIFDYTLARGSTVSPHTGPAFDHTYGNSSGYFIYIDNSAARNEGDPARLISPDVSFSSNQPKCLTFWYHMYGAHIGSLNVYLKSGGSLGSVFWSRKTSYGDQWNRAAVSLILSSASTRNIVLEATQGYRIHGDIGVDDISLADGYCTSDSFGCDFENDTLCNGANDGSDDFDWSVSSGDDGTGPSLDHTYESGTGHYLLAEGVATNRGQSARFLMPSLSLDSSKCLQFFYARQGAEVAVLSIRTKMDDNLGQPLWKRNLQIGDGWNTGRVSLRRQSDFQIAFEVVRGAGETGYVVIDDIRVLDGDCPNPSNCDFESGKCSWSNAVSGNELDWVLLNGHTSSGGTGPPGVDHTLGTEYGMYLYMEGSNSFSGDKAMLNSQTFPAKAAHGCVEFWYNMNGAAIGTLRVDIVTADDPTNPDTIWTLSGNQDSAWKYGRIPFLQTEEYQLIFVSVRGAGSTSDIAIDDIVVSDGYCLGVPSTATVYPPTVAPTSSNPCGPGKFTCTNGQCIDDSQYCDFATQCIDRSDEAECPSTCNFETGECGWYEGTDDTFGWYRARAYDTQLTPALAPRYDNTYKTLYGYYAYVHPVGSYTYPYSTAEYMSPVFSAAIATCRLNFYWYQNGLYPYYFEVWIVQGTVETKHFSYYYSMGDQWNNMIIGIGRQTSPWQIKFQKMRYSSYNAASAVDDLKFEKCAPPPPASFCNTGSNFWCTTSRACISKSLLCDLEDDCGDNSDELNCDSYSQCNFQNNYCDWSQASGTDHLTWIRRASSTPTAYTGPSFDHTYGNVTGYYMYIEGYYNYYGKTAQLVSQIYRASTGGSCQMRLFYHMFGENIGKLTVYTRIYHNTNQGQTVVWQQVGPKGSYWERAEVAIDISTDFQVVIEATAGDYYYGDIAIDDVTFTPSCVPSTSSQLPAAPPTTPPPFPPSTTQHPACKDKEFYCSTDKRCVSRENVCNFRNDCSDGEEETARCVTPTCDFESGLCGWLGVPESTGRKRRAGLPEFKFERKQGKTKLPSEYRPSKDHTTDSGDGYYVFADNSPGQNLDTTEIYTPVIGSTGPNCHLEFYFHKGSRNYYGTLEVRKTFGNTTKTLFSHYGNQPDWTKATVYVGAGQAFQIVFVALRGSYYYGDECVDDVKFLDCAPPVITGDPCLSSEYTCANKFCIDKSKVCNFVDDCMDHSDEDHCDSLAGRCNFEVSPCDWKQEGGDNFDWSLMRGGTYSSGTGPSIDHTTRTPKGGYLYIETNYPQRPYYIARIASPTILGSSSNCRLNLWYHMYGPNIGSLSILQRVTYLENSMQVLQNVTGDQGDYWYNLDIPITTGGKNFKIVLEGMVGNGYYGDIAIDDVTFSDGCIQGGTIPGEDTATAPPSHDSCGDDPRKLSCKSGSTCFESWQRCNFIEDCPDGSDESSCGTSCDFEDDFCGWRNVINDKMNWTIATGPSWTTYTGPDVDHTKGTALGQFMFFYSRVSYTYQGDPAHLQSLTYQHSSENCKLVFWYHMFCSLVSTLPYMGTLSVYVKYGNHQTKELFHLSGDQGDSWQQATVDVGKWEEFELVFEATRGYSIYGDIGIDDIEFQNCADDTFERPCDDFIEFQCASDGNCIPLDRQCDYQPDCTDGSDEEDCIVKPQDCHFDDVQPLCEWEQNEGDNFDWVTGKSTSSADSGPSFDHTTGNSTGNSLFAYVDSSVQEAGDITRISTPADAVFPASKGVCTIRFWYHMYSASSGSVGVLRLYTAAADNDDQMLPMWHKQGNQGNQWNYDKVVIGNPHDFRVVFEVIMGDKFSSDIAVDDVTFTLACIDPDNTTLVGSCQRNHFFCPGDNMCIPNSWLNDGNVDCPTDCYDEDELRFNCGKKEEIGDDPKSGGGNAGVIAGAVIGGLVLAGLIILVVVFGVRRFRQKGGASFSGFNINFSNDTGGKVNMGDDIVNSGFDEAPQEYSVDNPMYGKG